MRTCGQHPGRMSGVIFMSLLFTCFRAFWTYFCCWLFCWEKLIIYMDSENSAKIIDFEPFPIAVWKLIFKNWCRNSYLKIILLLNILDFASSVFCKKMSRSEYSIWFRASVHMKEGCLILIEESTQIFFRRLHLNHVLTEFLDLSASQ